MKIYLHKKSIKTKTAQDSDIYKLHRNNYNTALRLSKQKYYAENLQKYIKNPKRTWDLLKEAANLNKSSSKIDSIEKNGLIITDPKEIADEFNDYFTNIGIQISESVMPTIKKPEDYMPTLDNITD